MYEFILSTIPAIKTVAAVASPIMAALSWLWARRAANMAKKAQAATTAAMSAAKAEADWLASQPITIVLRDNERRRPLPFRPARREVATRAGLFGAIGAVAGARRFDLGHGLLKVVSSGIYEKVLSGESTLLEVPCPAKEFDEFKLDAEAFTRGEARQQPKPPPQARPLTEEAAVAMEARFNELVGHALQAAAMDTKNLGARLDQANHADALDALHIKQRIDRTGSLLLGLQNSQDLLQAAVADLLHEWRGPTKNKEADKNKKPVPK